MEFSFRSKQLHNVHFHTQKLNRYKWISWDSWSRGTS